MDCKKYKEKKEDGRVVIIEAGDSFAASTKQFDCGTGLRLPDEVIEINIDELTNRKQDLLDEISDITLVIADCQKLKKKK